jgi:hypothetical protein
MTAFMQVASIMGGIRPSLATEFHGDAELLRRFCVKIRHFTAPKSNELQVFQTIYGGKRFNELKTQEVPDPDPLEEV